ncbi:glycosyltransferase [Cellulophaga lytica]|nr:glycosyltransferase [Cellulophaga lytica]
MSYKKSILFIIESLHCGGAEKSLVTLLNNIDLIKYNVDLLILKKGGEFEKFVPKEIEVNTIKIKESNLLSKFFFKMKFFILRKTHKDVHNAQLFWKAYSNQFINQKKEYDLAIGYNQGFSTYYTIEKVQAKSKLSWLNTDYKKAGYVISEDINYYKKLNKVICVSEENEASFLSELKTINNKIKTVVIKDITDKKVIQKLSLENISENISNSSFTSIITVGRLAKAKGYELAIEACSILIKNGVNVKWFVIGEGPERINLEKLIVTYKLEEHFILLGFKENPYPYIKAADIYVQTSLFEGLGLSVIEASFLNKPIVATNFPSVYNIIENKKTGLITDMTPSAISAAVKLYINDDEFKTTIVNNLSSLENTDKEKSLEKINNLILNLENKL